MNEDCIHTYDGYLLFEPLPEERLAKIENLIAPWHPDCMAGSTFLELRYTGRDTNRGFVRLLAEIAALLVDARGEITCQIDGDEGDPIFEFYRIQSGRLLRQRGEIVRGEAETISQSGVSLG